MVFCYKKEEKYMKFGGRKGENRVILPLRQCEKIEDGNVRKLNNKE